MYYTAVVKGSPDYTFLAARDRGMETTVERYLPASNETVLVVNGSDLEKLARWHAEPGVAPFPPGTCLIYSEHPHKGFEHTTVRAKGESE